MTVTPWVGQMIDNGDVENAALQTVAYWIDFYLGVKERQKNWTVGQLARPNGYVASYDIDNWPEVQVPAIIVNCPGTVEEPLRYGNGVGAWFEVNVDAAVVGQTEQETREIAGAYASVLATLLEQQSELMGTGSTPFASDCLFQAWRLELPDQENRTLAVATCTFHVKVDEIFIPQLAPSPPPLPSSQDPGDVPSVDAVNVTLTEIPADGSTQREHVDTFTVS